MSQFGAHKRAGRPHDHFDEDDDDDEPDDDSFAATDRIRRSYNRTAANEPSAAAASTAHSAPCLKQENIQVKLDEGYFANERQLFINSLANVRQKLNSLRMFNPAKNENLKQQQQEWNEKEKYTLDSLNEFKGPLDERSLWSRPEDGREVWSSKLQYMLAITSYSIGLGNVIRFPILVQKNGGLAFIIPFVIMLLLEGIPLFYLELAIGQRTRKAAISCWHSVSPFAAGIGLASGAVSFLIGLYYNTMVAWTLLYSWSALTNKFAQLAQCPAGDGPTLPAHELSGYNSTGGSQTQTRAQSATNSSASECELTGPFEWHWYRGTLDVSAQVDDWSHFNWPVAVCLAAAWLLSYLCLVRGLSSSKRLVYVVSILPYVILVLFLAKALQLPGMADGLRFFIAPDYRKLADPYVWLQAAAQVFFSLGLGFGGLIALSSYNSINNNCYRDAIRVSLINFLTSILAGLLIFAILGFKANLSLHECQLEREQQIDFYLADYNLKVLDYGAVFKQVPMKSSDLARIRVRRRTMLDETDSQSEAESRSERPKTKAKAKQSHFPGKSTTTRPTTSAPATPATATTTTASNSRTSSGKKAAQNDNKKLPTSGKGVAKVKPAKQVTEFVAEKNATATGKLREQIDQTIARTKPAAAPEDETDEYSAEDAIASINNLDRQLDLGSASGSFDYGDSDTEFVLNASNLISGADLGRIIESINNLQKCSLQEELERSMQGTGLVFVVMVEAISEFDEAAGGYLSSASWAMLFFLMILTLGLDSQFGNLEGLLSSLTDLNFFNLKPNRDGQHASEAGGQLAGPTGCPAGQPAGRSITLVRQLATGTICLLSLLISVALFAHGAGSYMFAIFDEYASNFSLILIALFELLAISYIYGLKRFCNDCELMTGKRPPFLVLLSWRYISPILLLVIVCTTIKQFAAELNYDVWSSASPASGHLISKTWPGWAVAFGAALIVGCIIWIPLIAGLRILRINLIPEEAPQRCWFPADELKEFHQLQDQEHQVTKLERLLFGFRSDDDDD